MTAAELQARLLWQDEIEQHERRRLAVAELGDDVSAGLAFVERESDARRGARASSRSPSLRQPLWQHRQPRVHVDESRTAAARVRRRRPARAGAPQVVAPQIGDQPYW